MDYRIMYAECDRLDIGHSRDRDWTSTALVRLRTRSSPAHSVTSYDMLCRRLERLPPHLAIRLSAADDHSCTVVALCAVLSVQLCPWLRIWHRDRSHHSPYSRNERTQCYRETRSCTWNKSAGHLVTCTLSIRVEKALSWRKDRDLPDRRDPLIKNSFQLIVSRKTLKVS